MEEDGPSRATDGDRGSWPMSDDEDYHDALSSCSWSSAVEQEQEDGPGAVLGQHGQGVEGIALRGRAHLALDHAVRLHQEGGLPVAPEKPPEADPHAHTCAGAVPAHKTMPAEKTAVDITAPYAADAQRLSSWGFAWACVEKAAHGAARAAAAARGSTPGIGSQNAPRATPGPASTTDASEKITGAAPMPDGERTCAICLENLETECAGGVGFVCVPQQTDAADESGWSGCCGAEICAVCIATYLSQQIREGSTDLRCPGQCRRALADDEVRRYVDATALHRLRNKRALTRNHLLRMCPSCSFLNEGSRMAPDITCGNCSTSFCFAHELAHPGRTCREYTGHARAVPELEETDVRTRCILWHTTVACPQCKMRVQRNGGCNHMTCICGTHFAFCCGKRMTRRDLGRLPHKCTAPSAIAKKAAKVLAAAPVVVVAGATAVALSIVGLPIAYACYKGKRFFKAGRCSRGRA
eukprot:Tamp_13546.p1 GENE.Tamp_13546~~Tamp_13546.p1  ORF type:complete len:469 (+),score=35.26 Tamp_13546:116-1522(+)